VYPVADYVTYANDKYCTISTVNDENCMALVATIIYSFEPYSTMMPLNSGV